jgi:WD40-like Beta Propeller Repeat
MRLDFEDFGTWRIGDEHYGTFTQSAQQRHSGQFSGKLAYQLPAVAKNYVVFRRIPAATISGRPEALKLWVYGDGSGHFLNAWVRDSQGEVRQFSFGRVNHSGQWQEMVAPLDTTAAWPQGHISGLDNRRLDFPISLDALVLDGVPDRGGPFAGAIYVDDLGATDLTAPQTPVATSRITGTPAPPATGKPPTGLTGHIVYTSSTGGATAISVLDVANLSTWQLRSDARQPDIRDDSRVVYNGTGGGKNNIFSVNLDGSHEVMNGTHTEDSYPSWSPTGLSIVFHSTLQGDGLDRIYIQFDMTHTEDPKPLQINKADVFGKYPTWLETWRIAYTGCNYWDTGSHCGIWSLNSDGSGDPVRIVSDPPAISTDSANGVLLYASPTAGNWEVYAVPEAGGTPQNLTNHPGQDAGGTFSPNGRYVAFMSNRDGGWGIWVMNVDGTNARKLLAVPSFGADWAEERLAWGP